MGPGAPPLPSSLTRTRGGRCRRSQVYFHETRTPPARPAGQPRSPRTLRGLSREGHRPRTPGGPRHLVPHQRARRVRGDLFPSRAELQTESKPSGPALPAEGTRSSRGPQQPRCSAPADGSKQSGPGEPLTYRSRLLLPGQSRGGGRGTFTETLDPQRGCSAGSGPGGGRHVADG